MDTGTSTVIGWALSTPVLTKWLAVIVQDESANGVEELPYTVADLLSPRRDHRAVMVLSALGAPLQGADRAWKLLSRGDDEGWQWMNAVDWDMLRQAVLDSHARDCAVLCAGAHD